MVEKTKHVDNLVLGGGLIGCTTAWVLSRQGYSGTVLEKSQSLGGINNSFRDELGNIFDIGEHSLEYGRSEFTTNFFDVVLDGKVRKFKFNRGLLIEKELIPYASQVDKWPEKLKNKIEINTDAPKLSVNSPKEDFELAYGSWFTDLLFNEMIESYPDLKWKHKNGVSYNNLLKSIFPWFCPLTNLEEEPSNRNDYHYNVRHTDMVEEHLYPENNGFGNWIDQMVEQAKPELNFCLAQSNIDFTFGESELMLKSVESKGVKYTFDNAYWCIPIPVLFKIKNWELPERKTKKYLIGSFTFENTFGSAYHEILCADPDIPIGKVSFPGKIQGKESFRTVQVEHTTLQNINQYNDQEWKNNCVNSLQNVGIIGQKNKVINFDIKKRQGVVTAPSADSVKGMFQDKMKTRDTNMTFPCIINGPTNFNTIVPTIFDNIFSCLTKC